MEEEKWRVSTSPNSTGAFLSRRRTSDCHLSVFGRSPLSAGMPLSPPFSTSLPSSRPSVNARRWSALGGQRDLLPEPVRVSNPIVGVFRHAPCTRGFKDMLWEPSFSTAKPTLTQMDLARQVRFKSRHVEQDELCKLPAKLFQECSRWQSGAYGSETGENQEDPAGAPPPHCVICIEGFDPKEYVRELPGCGHVFHKRCIDLWLRGVCSFEACYTRSCPVCKTPIDFNGTQQQGDEEEEAHGGRYSANRAKGGGAAGGYEAGKGKEEGEGVGLMSRICDAVIPRWAFAQVGSALMHQDATAAQENRKERESKAMAAGYGGGRPPCDETMLQQ